MVEKDWWVYQRRAGVNPWSLYIVCRYDRKKPKDTMEMDVSCYHESIDPPLYRKTWYGLRQDSMSDFADDISDKIAEILEVTDEDRAQLQRSLDYLYYEIK